MAVIHTTKDFMKNLRTTESLSTGHVAILLTNILFGINIAVSKNLLGRAIDPLGLNSLRYLFGCTAFWLLSLFYKEKVSIKDMPILFFGSILGLIFNQYFFLIGLEKTSPIDASIIATSLPILTMILSALILKEPITLTKVSGVLVGASGAIYLIYSSRIGHKGYSSFVGNLYCFASCVSFSLYYVLSKPVIQKYRSTTIMKWMFLFAALLFLPFGYGRVQALSFSAFSNMDLASLSYILIFATVAPYLLIPVGQKYLRPTTLAMYNYLQPIIATMLAIMVGQDSFTFPKGIAAILVFTGVYIVTRSKSRAEVEAALVQSKDITRQ